MPETIEAMETNGTSSKLGNNKQTHDQTPALDSDEQLIELKLNTPSKFRLNIHLDEEELLKWNEFYLKDNRIKSIIDEIRKEADLWNPKYPYYFLSDQGLLYFEDSEGNLRLYVPDGLRSEILKEEHDQITNGAHAGGLRTYYRLTQTYYWPKMMKDAKDFCKTCDICQKAKHKRHPGYGTLKPLPIPYRPFEIITMDFIPELPKSKKGYDNILVIIDKLTKYAIFVPTITKVTAKDTAQIIFKHVFSCFGLPREIVSDRDSKWISSFWEETCRQFNIRRALSTAYHPQTDGQSEIMNQVLEVALRCYVGPKRDDWDLLLDSFSLSYNTTPHSATRYAPSFLLFGYLPTTGSNTLRNHSQDVSRALETEPLRNDSPDVLDIDADQFVTSIEAHRTRAKESLIIGQSFQLRAYNKNRLQIEFEPGDLVLINLKSLHILDREEGLGKKLRQRFDGPFEVIEKVTPVAYRIRLDSTYRMHNVINITHLELYSESPSKFGPRVTREKHRSKGIAPQVEVEKIIAETKRKIGNRRVPYYRVRYAGFGPDHDAWLSEKGLENAPEILRQWEKRKRA